MLYGFLVVSRFHLSFTKSIRRNLSFIFTNPFKTAFAFNVLSWDNSKVLIAISNTENNFKR